jgi:hypothetical protein
MTGIATAHPALPTAATPLSRSFASARAALGRSLRGFAAAAELERRRPIEDPFVLSGLLRG